MEKPLRLPVPDGTPTMGSTSKDQFPARYDLYIEN
jgi:hypothetical protein